MRKREKEGEESERTAWNWRVTLHVGSELSDELFHQSLYLQDQAVILINKVGKSLVANESFLNGL